MYKILDCTLRDGGHINAAKFGAQNILQIVKFLCKSHIDIVELGFLIDTTYNKDIAYFNNINETTWIFDSLEEKHCDTQFSLMIRPDRYSNIESVTESKNIDIIRLAFYMKDIELTVKYANRLIDLGYKVFLNPVNSVGLTYEEIRKVIQIANKIGVFAITIVDTFGSLDMKSLKNIYALYSEVKDDIFIDLHLHENMSMATSLAYYFLNIEDQRNKVVDASLFGMGRSPGNLCTENIVLQLDEPKYDLEKIYMCIDTTILPLKNHYNWGYNPMYALSAKFNIHRSYPEFYLEKEIAYPTISRILLSLKSNANKKTFNKEFALQMLNENK